MTDPSDTPEDKENTVGTVMAGSEIRIVHPETGATVGIDEHGEFLVRGGVMAGYFENEAATREAIDADGWLHTGDLCSMDARGYVYVQGRLRDMIIRAGENIYCVEIENVLYQYPGVVDAAVVGVAHVVLGEEVKAIVHMKPGASATADEIRAHCRLHLADFKVPEYVEFSVAPLPRNPAGKILKAVLRGGDTAFGASDDQAL
jgi:acyl-CoA synthetase (AMP-forming)/AMP-acid ligase II